MVSARFTGRPVRRECAVQPPCCLNPPGLACGDHPVQAAAGRGRGQLSIQLPLLLCSSPLAHLRRRDQHAKAIVLHAISCAQRIMGRRIDEELEPL